MQTATLEMVVLFGGFVVLALLRVPIAFALLIASLVLFVDDGPPRPLEHDPGDVRGAGLLRAAGRAVLRPRREHNERGQGYRPVDPVGLRSGGLYPRRARHGQRGREHGLRRHLRFFDGRYGRGGDRAHTPDARTRLLDRVLGGCNGGELRYGIHHPAEHPDDSLGRPDEHLHRRALSRRRDPRGHDWL